jgi:hypothetical protein
MRHEEALPAAVPRPFAAWVSTVHTSVLVFVGAARRGSGSSVDKDCTEDRGGQLESYEKSSHLASRVPVVTASQI